MIHLHRNLFRPHFPFGAIVDFDFRNPLTPEEVQLFRMMFLEHEVLIIPAQLLSREDQVRVVGYLGPVPQNPVDVVSTDPIEGLNGSIKLSFHSDLAFAPFPDLGGSLYAVDVGERASSTRFISATRAYRALPTEMQRKVQRLTAVHVFPVDQSEQARCAISREDDPRGVHPVVLSHPISGKPILYVNEQQTASIFELSRAESEELLTHLFDSLYDERYVLDHRWQQGDLVIYDNLSLQHGREPMKDQVRRTLIRVCIAEKSFLEQYPIYKPQSTGFIDSRQAELAAKQK